jgi:Terminase RNaseH-like domain
LVEGSLQGAESHSYQLSATTGQLGGKIARATAVSPTIEAGNIYLLHPLWAPWVNDFIEECAAFPNGVHDDQVDAMTQALLYWNSDTRGFRVSHAETRLARGRFYFPSDQGRFQPATRRENTPRPAGPARQPNAHWSTETQRVFP